jgi:nucleoside-diphosphate-sugar epimerase
MKPVLIVGATGFVGSVLGDRLLAAGGAVRRALRRPQGGASAFDDVVVGDVDGGTDWSKASAGVDCVVHLAARVHVMHERSPDALRDYRAVNVDGTRNLARQAAAAGVRRFVFISSVKVNGEVTLPGKPFTPEDAPAPVDPYGVSKLEAERALAEIARATGLEVVVIRPVLIYGPGVKANFLAMLRWLHRGMPLPLGAIRNQRSLLAVDNLADLIATCIEHRAAANQTFMAADGEDLSTAELLRRLGEALGTPAKLWRVPPALLHAGAALIGRRAVSQRLCSSLQVDIGKTRSALDWRPPVSVNEGLRKVARSFLESQRA